MINHASYGDVTCKRDIDLIIHVVHLMYGYVCMLTSANLKVKT